MHTSLFIFKIYPKSYDRQAYNEELPDANYSFVQNCHRAKNFLLQDSQTLELTGFYPRVETSTTGLQTLLEEKPYLKHFSDLIAPLLFFILLINFVCLLLINWFDHINLLTS